MNIRQDERTWGVRILLNNKKCPYLYYPADYHGCKLKEKLGEKDDSCRMEICPMRVTDEVKP